MPTGKWSRAFGVRFLEATQMTRVAATTPGAPYGSPTRLEASPTTKNAAVDASMTLMRIAHLGPSALSMKEANTTKVGTEASPLATDAAEKIAQISISAD